MSSPNERISIPKDIGQIKEITGLLGTIIKLLSGPPKQENRASAFMKIEGLLGESRHEQHEGTIEVLDYHWSVAQPRAAAASYGSAMTTERAHFGDLVIYKAIDISSPYLAQGCASGRHLEKAHLSLTRAADESKVYMVYHIYDVIITSVRSGGRGYGERIPLEEVSFSYGKIEWEYDQLKVEDPKSPRRFIKGWNLKTNEKV
ncbi:MAG: type VI secretion system tube protein Hcp [Acidobacteriota bacterium]